MSSTRSTFMVNALLRPEEARVAGSARRWWVDGKVLISRSPWSAGDCGDLDQVVGQDPVSGPDPGPVEVIEAGAVPAVLPFEGADPGLATGPPLHCSAERSAVFVGLAGLAG